MERAIASRWQQASTVGGEVAVASPRVSEGHLEREDGGRWWQEATRWHGSISARRRKMAQVERWCRSMNRGYGPSDQSMIDRLL